MQQNVRGNTGYTVYRERKLTESSNLVKLVFRSVKFLRENWAKKNVDLNAFLKGH